MKTTRWSRWHHRFHQHLLGQPKLLPQHGRLLLAVSGGQDSMALLQLLLDLRHLHHWELKLWHGDHRWHEGSEQIASELQNWCMQQGLPLLLSHAGPVEAKTEATARTWRYQELLSHCNHLGCDAVTAHTASDRAETVIMNLARGSDLAGISSLPTKRALKQDQPDGPIVRRPLQEFSRSETAAICTELQLPIWVDPSNTSQAPARNRIRHSVLPVLEALHPGCSIRIAATAERLSHQASNRTELAELALQKLECNGGLDRKKMGKLSTTNRQLLLASWLKSSNVPQVSSKQLLQLCERLEPGQPGGKATLSKGWTMNWQGETIKLKHVKEEPATSRPVHPTHSAQKNT